MNSRKTPSLRRPRMFMASAVVLLSLVVIGGVSILLTAPRGAGATGGLTVQIVASPNLIVDSNVLTPPSWQPEVATVMGRICNTSGATINNVQAYIGNYTG